jgi:3-hydroxybutyryl-CoA dehydrogenase
MKSIKNVLVVGGGMMGKNIAFVLTANPALSVTVTDIAAQDVHAGIRSSCRQLTERGVLTEGELEARLGRIAFTTNMAGAPVKNA